jgi:holo-[acyl-carrier protein] synthase
MIVGIGTDICDIRRIASTLARKGDRFAQKVLGPSEWLVFQARRSRAESRGLAYLATRFSAKESFSKAIGLGMHMPMTWRACEILNLPSGQPFIRLHGDLQALCSARGWQSHVTLSDESDYVVSFVVVETVEGTSAATNGSALVSGLGSVGAARVGLPQGEGQPTGREGPADGL